MPATSSTSPKGLCAAATNSTNLDKQGSWYMPLISLSFLDVYGIPQALLVLGDAVQKLLLRDRRSL